MRRAAADPETTRSSTLIATWRGNDPTTAVTLQWLSVEDANVPVELRSADGGSSSHTISTVQRFGDSDWVRHRAELTELAPDTDYWIHIDRVASDLYVQTAPREQPDSLVFAAGGDIGTGDDVSRLHSHASGWDPLFGVVGGDLAYGDGMHSYKWPPFLRHWHAYMRSGQRLIPIVAAIGNHEVQSGMHANPDEAPYYYTLFDNTRRDRAYWAFDIGEYLSILLLDSNHTTPVAGDQTDWLEEALAERTDRQHLMAVYHVAAYPSVNSFAGGRDRGELREHWVPLFEEYGLDTAFEHDEHAYKRTYRLRNGEPHEDGIVYLGDGCWGLDPRTVTDREYLRVAEQSKNVIRVAVSADGTRQYTAVDETGATLDRHTDIRDRAEPETDDVPVEQPRGDDPTAIHIPTEPTDAAGTDEPTVDDAGEAGAPETEESPAEASAGGEESTSGFGVVGAIGGLLAAGSYYALHERDDDS